MQKVRTVLMCLCGFAILLALSAMAASMCIMQNPLTRFAHLQNYVAPVLAEKYGIPVIVENTEFAGPLAWLTSETHVAELRKQSFRREDPLDAYALSVDQAARLHFTVDPVVTLHVEVPYNSPLVKEKREALLRAEEDLGRPEFRSKFAMMAELIAMPVEELITITAERMRADYLHQHENEKFIIGSSFVLGAGNSSDLEARIPLTETEKQMLYGWRHAADYYAPIVSRKSAQLAIVANILFLSLFLAPRITSAALLFWQRVRQAKKQRMAEEQERKAAAAADAERERIAAARRETKRLQKAQRTSIAFTPRPAAKLEPPKPKRLNRDQVLREARAAVERANRLILQAEYENVANDITRERDLLQREIDSVQSDTRDRPHKVTHLAEHSARTNQTLSDLVALSCQAS